MKRIGLILVAIVFMAPNGFSQIINVPADQPSIQAGIDAAMDGDTVLVADSTYFENINFLGKAITVASYYLIDGDTSHIANTIIDGSIPNNNDTASTVVMISGEDTSSVICGFTISHGRGTLLTHNEITYQVGGGVYVNGSGGIIRDNYIISNGYNHYTWRSNYWLGLGIFAHVYNDRFLIIRNNQIRNNSLGGFGPKTEGAGAYISGGMIIVEGNSISNNTMGLKSGAEGGGIVYWGSDRLGVIPEVSIKNNIISGNGVEEDGGAGRGAAMILRGNGPDVNMTIYNNLIVNNLIDYGSDSYRNATGIYIQGIEASFVNNTIVNSEVGNNIYLDENARITLFNNIIWCGGEGITGLIAQPDRGNSITAKYNLIQGGWEGEGNIDADPIFETDSFSLAEGSPGIGYGKDSIEIDGAWYHAPSQDFYGNSRPHPIDNYVDLGAIESLYEEHVYIPDTAFLYALIEEEVDTDGDSLISFGEAEVINSLDIYRSSIDPGEIKDLTGLEAFVNLDSLRCTSTNVSSLDLTSNAALRWLDCRWNQLTSLDVSGNTALEEIYCEGNQLDSLIVSGCDKLSILTCYDNLLTHLDVSELDSLVLIECGKNRLTNLNVSGCKKLFALACYNNLLTNLDVSTNVALNFLEVGRNQLSTLNVSANSSLKDLECFDNQLTSLDVSENSVLYKISCGGNQLTSLDVSANTSLELLFCSSNQLASLDISKNVLLRAIHVEEMPTLYEVCVWTTPFPPEGTRVDSMGSPNINFTTECATGFGENQSDKISISPNPVNTILSIEAGLQDYYSVVITSLNGQLLFSGEMEGTTHQLDLSSFRKGIYFITIRSKDFVTIRKIIKH